MSEVPYAVMQQRYRGEPWRLLVGCVLCNRTRGRSAMPIAAEVFRRWPDPIELALADERELAEVLRPLGFQNRRAATLREFSREWCVMGFYHWLREAEGRVTQFAGMGAYAQASYDIFIRGRRDVETSDPMLSAYLAALA